MSGIQSERVRVSEQDGLPARSESSLVSRAYCHDNIHHITQQCHSGTQPQYCCSLNTVFDMKVLGILAYEKQLHLNVQALGLSVIQ